MKQSSNPQQGFSLLEVFITLFIIGVILLLYQVSFNNLLLSRNIKDQEIALRVANNKIEALRAEGYDTLPASGSFSDSQLDSLPGALATMTITDFNTDTKQIIITIQWQEPGIAIPQTLSLATLITKTGGL